MGIVNYGGDMDTADFVYDFLLKALLLLFPLYVVVIASPYIPGWFEV